MKGVLCNFQSTASCCSDKDQLILHIFTKKGKGELADMKTDWSLKKSVWSRCVEQLWIFLTKQQNWNMYPCCTNKNTFQHGNTVFSRCRIFQRRESFAFLNMIFHLFTIFTWYSFTLLITRLQLRNTCVWFEGHETHWSKKKKKILYTVLISCAVSQRCSFYKLLLPPAVRWPPNRVSVSYDRVQ